MEQQQDLLIKQQAQKHLKQKRARPKQGKITNTKSCYVKLIRLSKAQLQDYMKEKAESEQVDITDFFETTTEDPLEKAMRLADIPIDRTTNANQEKRSNANKESPNKNENENENGNDNAPKSQFRKPQNKQATLSDSSTDSSSTGTDSSSSSDDSDSSSSSSSDSDKGGRDKNIKAKSTQQTASVHLHTKP